MRIFRFWFGDESFRVIEAPSLEKALEQLTDSERRTHTFTEMGGPVRGIQDVDVQ